MKRVVSGEVYGKKKGAGTRKQNGSRSLEWIEELREAMVVPEVPTDGSNLNA